MAHKTASSHTPLGHAWFEVERVFFGGKGEGTARAQREGCKKRGVGSVDVKGLQPEAGDLRRLS